MTGDEFPSESGGTAGGAQEADAAAEETLQDHAAQGRPAGAGRDDVRRLPGESFSRRGRPVLRTVPAAVSGPERGPRQPGERDRTGLSRTRGQRMARLPAAGRAAVRL